VVKSSNVVMCFAVWVVAAASASAQPSAGVWEWSVTQQGAPAGGGTRTGKACLAAEALATAPEQTLIDAASRQGGGRQGPKCEFKGIQRNGASSSWQAVCDGPRGKMQGLGAATLGADAAELQQAFTVEAPMGTLNVKQIVSARRVGSC
jgi:hypothetical protein